MLEPVRVVALGVVGPRLRASGFGPRLAAVASASDASIRKSVSSAPTKSVLNVFDLSMTYASASNSRRMRATSRRPCRVRRRRGK